MNNQVIKNYKKGKLVSFKTNIFVKIEKLILWTEEIF